MNKYIALTAAFVISLGLNSCTENFQELNTSPVGVSDEEANADYALISSFMAQAQRAVIPAATNPYQVGNNLCSDAYAGYLGAQNPFLSNANNMTYRLEAGWYSSIWNEHYINAMNPLHKVILLSRDNEGLQDIFALAKMVKVAAMHRVADKIGPIIYSNYNNPNDDGAIEYDAQPDVYKAFFLDLDTAMNVFKSLKDEPVSPAMSKADLSYDGNSYVQLLKVANTLRLRLAMRISMVDPGWAQTEGEKALDPANGGLLEEVSDSWKIELNGIHPLNTINENYSDTRMGAPMESFMVGYKDPRLAKRFLPAEDPAVAGRYKGIRSGINIDAKSRYDNYSRLVTLEPYMQLMPAAEAWFLKAEAALRGWNGAGDAKSNYEMGIATSFESYNLNAGTYINDATSTPAPYIDPKSVTPGENDVLKGSEDLSTITIKWEESASKNEKLERIITQKWLAIYPDGDEAWAEYRRTGYPILFPVVVNLSNGAIPTRPGIRRMPFSQREYNTNEAATTAAVDLLNGPDNGGTRLWWDVEDKLF